MSAAAPHPDCPVFVITLEHAAARRATIGARLAELQLPCEFRSGVDGRKLDLLSHAAYAPLWRRFSFGRDLSPGEFGCVLAHREIYRHMVAKQVPKALVLEDDAILADELPTVIAALDKVQPDWDLVRFLGRPKNYQASRIIGPLPGVGSELARPLGTPGGAYGYLLTLKAAECLLQLMERNWLAIDTLHGLVWMTGLETLAVVPSPVLPNDAIPSCIDGLDDNARWDKRIQVAGWQRRLYPVTRGAWKLYLNLHLGWVRLRNGPKDRRLGRRLAGWQH